MMGLRRKINDTIHINDSGKVQLNLHPVCRVHFSANNFPRWEGKTERKRPGMENERNRGVDKESEKGCTLSAWEKELDPGKGDSSSFL